MSTALTNYGEASLSTALSLTVFHHLCSCLCLLTYFSTISMQALSKAKQAKGKAGSFKAITKNDSTNSLHGSIGKIQSSSPSSQYRLSRHASDRERQQQRSRLQQVTQTHTQTHTQHTTLSLSLSLSLSYAHLYIAECHGPFSQSAALWSWDIRRCLEFWAPENTSALSMLCCLRVPRLLHSYILQENESFKTLRS